MVAGGEITKQIIEPEQLDELNDNQRKRLQELWVVNEGDYIAWKNTGRQKKWYVELNSNNEYGYVADPNTQLKGRWEFPLCSVGRMIEFIYEHLKTDWSIHAGEDLLFVGLSDRSGFWGKTPENRSGELCDGLWEIMKIILNDL